MRKLFLAIALLFISNAISGQNVTLEEEQIIKTLVQDAFDDVWSKYDTNSLKIHHTDDFLLLEHGHIWNNDTIASYQAKGLKRSPVTRINSFDFIKFEKYGESIWAAYHNFATFTVNDGETSKMQWLESIVAVKTTTGYKLKMMHSTRVPAKRK